MNLRSCTILTRAGHARSDPAALAHTHRPEEPVQAVAGSTAVRQLSAEWKHLLTDWTVTTGVLDDRRIAAPTCASDTDD